MAGTKAQSMGFIPLGLGIDLGTSGVRIVVTNLHGRVLHSEGCEYSFSLEHWPDWCDACRNLIQAIPNYLRQHILAIAIDGTSGTLLACKSDGLPIGNALPYYLACPEQASLLRQLMPLGGPAASVSGSLARALRLIERTTGIALLRHQADWVGGWLMQNWHWGEESNNLRLGWDLLQKRWPASLEAQPWHSVLPQICPSGSVLGAISLKRSRELGLRRDISIIAGTTDANAAVLTASPGPEDGVSVLGSTLVLKKFVCQPPPIAAPGVSLHRVHGRWLAGGASNTGCRILMRFFSAEQLEVLSRQIDPEHDSGLRLRPMLSVGERFPVDDPELEPILTPRPVSDSLFLQGLLEGLTHIEAAGWKRLISLGVPAPQRIISIGGGACNPQWRRMRERILGLPVKTCRQQPAAGMASLALKAVT